VDVFAIVNDGNLIDAIYFAVLISLLNYKKPYVSVRQNDVEIVPNKFQNLSIHHLPILYTFAIYSDKQVLVLDPTVTSLC
jgi:exosome complex RNA-binding protein Rrp42 (RNase PH superfamily)